MSDKLEPCHRCGSNQSYFERWVITDEAVVLYRAICGACECAPDHWEEIPEKAAEYWNTRQIEDALRGQLTQLREDMALANKAMRAALVLVNVDIEGELIPLPEQIRVRDLLRSALRE